MIEVVCWFQVCLNVANAGMACHEHGKGSYQDLMAFIKKHQGTNNVVLLECPKPGEKPSLTFDLAKGLRMREGKK